MEAGYVIGGAPKENVVRRSPRVGDVVILLGGETGRDGIGGATGSSRAHSSEAVEESGGPKGNPPEERKIQRLFRDPKLSQMIVKSNDFGAGGVCVAIGELSDGVDIYLEKVPTKYEGLTATEIAISESQERMAVVIDSKNIDAFIKKSREENLNAVVVADITDLNRMRMFYVDEVICDIERSFLNTNGVRQVQDVVIEEDVTNYFNTIDEDVAKAITVSDYESALCNQISNLENCSRKGISDTFDATIGASTVILPYGGKRQTTPATIMASKPPVSGFTKTVTCSSYGLYPELMITSPYVGATYSVIAAISKLIASGVDYSSIYMTFQEYFLRVGKDPVRWGQPLSALLGAFDAQMNLKIGSIGGKDSMSGTYDDIDVPPTLAAFAMGLTTDDKIIHNAFGTKGHVFRFSVKKDKFSRPDYEALKNVYLTVEKLIKDGKVLYSAVVEGSTIVTIAKSLLGNFAGMDFAFMDESLFLPTIGDIIIVSKESKLSGADYLGKLNASGEITYPNGKISLVKVDNAFQSTLEPVFTTKVTKIKEEVKNVSFNSTKTWKATNKVVKPKVFMPLFPGTNSEYDLIKDFELAGAEVETFVVRNMSAEDIDYSIKVMVDKINKAQIFALPGGAITGNEPNGPSKFATAFLTRKELKDAILDLLYKRDGLAIGIANGFQTLVKLGLVPAGDIDSKANDTITFVPNDRGRHIATMVNIRVSSNNSPWMSSFKVGEVYNLPFSNAFGKLVLSSKDVDKLIANGQITTQYCDENGNATIDSDYNPAGAIYAIDSLSSPCGRVIGIMSHVDRWQEGNYQNLNGNFEMDVIANGIKYYQ
jgi:phosphoribosylformylglycinamidine synthase